MKRLRTRKLMKSIVIITGSVASVLLSFVLWMLVQFNVMIAVAIAVVLTAIIALVVNLISDKGIMFDEYQFVVKSGEIYTYHEIDEVVVKYSEYDYRRYKAIVIKGEEVCCFDDNYENAKEFISILEKHGFDVKPDSIIMD